MIPLIRSGRRRYALVTLLPLAWLVAVTMTGAWQKLFHAAPRIGFLSQARRLEAGLAAGGLPLDLIAVAERMIFNCRLDAAVRALFAGLVLALLGVASRAWWREPRRPFRARRQRPGRPPPVTGPWRALRSLTGDLAYEQHLDRCRRSGQPPLSPAQLYLERLERRYRSPARCC